MRYYQACAVFLLSFVLSASAVPLNINLGAYSPALVVGDGEISLGAEKEVASIMTALSGAAATADAEAIVDTTENAVTEAVNAAEEAQVVTPPVAITSTSESLAASTSAAIEASALTGQGLGRKEIDPRSPVPEPAPVSEPEVELDVDSGSVIPTINDLTDTLFKRVVATGNGDLAVKLARDLQGFQAALQFAEDAIKLTPEIQLGTGANGAGVGILQAPGISAGTTTAKRSLSADSEVLERDSPKVEKRVSQVPEVDSVNLNIGSLNNRNGVHMSITEIQN